MKGDKLPSRGSAVRARNVPAILWRAGLKGEYLQQNRKSPEERLLSGMGESAPANQLKDLALFYLLPHNLLFAVSPIEVSD